MPLATLPNLTRRSFGLALAGAGVTVLHAQSGAQHWALLADTHVPANPADGHRGFSPIDNLKKVIPQVLAAKPESALICGDVARLAGLAEDYSVLRTMLEPVTAAMPVAMALGNHDDRKNFLAAFASTQQGAQSVPQRHVLVVEGPAVRLVVLDSLIQPNLTPGLLGRAQRNWLRDYLDKAGDLPTLICVHHTLDDADGALLDVPRLFDILGPQRKVKAILYGHSHRYHYDEWNGIHLVNLPAVGYNFADNQPVGWVDARFTRQGGRFTLRAIAGNVEQNGKTVELKWRP